MARSVPYIRTIGDNASWRQDQALNATIYILREIGPTGYLLKEEGETKKFKVLIGDPHSCTCPVFRKEKDVCKHICWVLLKKFKVPRQNPVTWQLGLVEREINELLRGLMTRQPAARRPASVTASATKSERPCLEQREISADDVCPICQDEFLSKHEPVTYCKYGCGNNIHIKCMKIWAEHQKSVGEPEIKCPMCRHDFGPYELLRQEYNNSSSRTTRAERLSQHLGTTCNKCRISPIQGKCYKCSTCAELYLCQVCFNSEYHRQHSFVFRQKSSQRWRHVERGTGGALPQAVVNNLMNRDIGEEDYDLLLQLDNQENQTSTDIPEEFIKSLPCMKIRSPTSKLLEPGQQCRVCLRSYEMGQFVRRLPCNHKFHVDCIDAWLMHQRPYCPLDGHQVWSPGTTHHKAKRKPRDSGAGPTDGVNGGITAGHLLLEIPGIGIASRSAPRSSSANQSVLRAVDHTGHVHTLSGPLTMTGSRITPTRPDWLAVENRTEDQTFVAPPVGHVIASSNQRRLPPSGRLRLVGRPRATPTEASLVVRRGEVESSAASELLIGRRASESEVDSPDMRSRQRIRLASNVRTRSNSRERRPSTNHNADFVSRDVTSMHLGQSPSCNNTGSAGREKIPRPRLPRPPTDSGAATRHTEDLDIQLTGFQLQ